MSRTPSSASLSVQRAGMGSNIYTLLLIVATVALVVTAVYLATVMESRYGFSMPFGDAYARAKTAPQQALNQIASDRRAIDESLTNFVKYTSGQEGSAGSSATP